MSILGLCATYVQMQDKHEHPTHVNTHIQALTLHTHENRKKTI